MDFANTYFVKLYRSQSPDWIVLSPLTRGLLGELLLLADKLGRIPLGKAGLPSIAAPLRGSWAELEPHVRALLADGCIVEEPGALLIPNFEAAQGRAKTAADRKADQREREKDREQGAKSQPPIAPEEPVTGHAVSRDVTPTVTLRDVSHPAPAPVTRHDSHDKERKTYRSTTTTTTPPAGAREPRPPLNVGSAGILAEIGRHAELTDVCDVDMSDELSKQLMGGKTLADLGRGIEACARDIRLGKLSLDRLGLSKMLRKYVANEQHQRQGGAPGQGGGYPPGGYQQARGDHPGGLTSGYTNEYTADEIRPVGPKPAGMR